MTDLGGYNNTLISRVSNLDKTLGNKLGHPVKDKSLLPEPLLSGPEPVGEVDLGPVQVFALELAERFRTRDVERLDGVTQAVSLSSLLLIVPVLPMLVGFGKIIRLKHVGLVVSLIIEKKPHTHTQ